jgi:hypothetical protein
MFSCFWTVWHVIFVPKCSTYSLLPSTSVTRPRYEDVIDWIMLNCSTFHMRSLLAIVDIHLLRQICLLWLCAWWSRLTVRGNKTNVAKKRSHAFPRSRIFCEWFEWSSLRLKCVEILFPYDCCWRWNRPPFRKRTSSLRTINKPVERKKMREEEEEPPKNGR